MTVRTKERRWNRLSATKAKRYRLTVPDADVSTQQWLASQINFSNSIRALIREDIMKNGFTDVSCRPVEQGLKRGRPSNAELERREQVTQTDTIQGGTGSCDRANTARIFGITDTVNTDDTADSTLCTAGFVWHTGNTAAVDAAGFGIGSNRRTGSEG